MYDKFQARVVLDYKELCHFKVDPSLDCGQFMVGFKCCCYEIEEIMCNIHTYTMKLWSKMYDMYQKVDVMCMTLTLWSFDMYTSSHSTFRCHPISLPFYLLCIAYHDVFVRLTIKCVC